MSRLFHMPHLVAFMLLLLLSSCNNAGRREELGVVMGSVADLAILGGSGEIEYNIRRFNNTAEMIHALESGRIDRAVVETTSLESRQMQALDLEVTESSFLVGGQPVRGDARVAFNPSDTALAGQFNRFLSAAAADGRLDMIVRRWTCAGTSFLEAASDHDGSDDGNTGSDVLEVGVIFGNIPFCFAQDGRVSGIEADIIREFAASTGRRAVFHEYEIIMMQAGLDAGRIDMAAGLLSESVDRVGKVLFSDPYCSFEYSVIAAGHAHARKTGLISEFRRVFISEGRYMFVVEGVAITLVISFFSLLFGTLAGMLITWRTRVSRFSGVWHRFMEVFGKIIHGIPLLVLLLLMYYLVLSHVVMSGIMVSIITFSIYFTYVSAEIFISGLKTVTRGQREAAASLGFTPYQTFRYVTLPQALKRIVPYFESEMTTLIKETSLVGFIAIVDLTRASDVIQSITFNAYLPLLLISGIYFLIIWLAGKGLAKLVSRISRVL